MGVPHLSVYRTLSVLPHYNYQSSCSSIGVPHLSEYRGKTPYHQTWPWPPSHTNQPRIWQQHDGRATLLWEHWSCCCCQQYKQKKHQQTIHCLEDSWISLVSQCKTQLRQSTILSYSIAQSVKDKKRLTVLFLWDWVPWLPPKNVFPSAYLGICPLLWVVTQYTLSYWARQQYSMWP